MLQLKTAGHAALDSLRRLGAFPPRVDDIAALESITDRFLERFMDERLRISNELGPGFLFYELLDRGVRSRDREHMDEASTGGQEKLELVQALDRMNDMTFAYRHQTELLDPVIAEISARRGGATRVLELASGSGGLAFALAAHALDRGIRLDITASDIIPETVAAGNRTAAERGLQVDFTVMNAFDFSSIEKNSFDLVVVSQSLHHFSPGQIALMIAGSKAHGASAFVGLDGRRSMLLLVGVPLVASLQGNVAFTSDGLTSARKFYSELELDIIACIATGEEGRRVTGSWPMSMLHVRFDDRPS